ncbi:MAG: hypothetical protein HZC05_02435 [Candidatus Magasanikbacteria bacterium]|nr:hypothetical protein [Candidatus Magasanikbacteria bacterium]
MPPRDHGPTYPEYIIASFEDMEEVHPPESPTSFIVRDSLNPYREALLVGGVVASDPAVAERKDMAIDLDKILESDIVSYRASNLLRWASALESVKGDLRLTPEKRAIIEQEVKEGAIIIFMPGRATQLETTVDEYQQLRPKWIKDSQPQTLDDTYIWDHLASLISNKDQSLVQAVPVRPYFMLIKPTATVEPRTVSKTVDLQKQELVKINQERKTAGLAPAQVVNPAEYAAFMQLATERVQQLSSQPLNNLTPPDDVNVSYNSFINLPLSSGGNVPRGYFYPDDRRLRFGWGGAAGADAGGGFRLSVRTEI